MRLFWGNMTRTPIAILLRVARPNILTITWIIHRTPLPSYVRQRLPCDTLRKSVAHIVPILRISSGLFSNFSLRIWLRVPACYESSWHIRRVLVSWRSWWGLIVLCPVIHAFELKLAANPTLAIPRENFALNLFASTERPPKHHIQTLIGYFRLFQLLGRTRSCLG